MVGAASRAEELGVRWRYVNFYSVVYREKLRRAMLIQSFLGDFSHEGFMRGSEGVKRLGGYAEGVRKLSR